MSEKRFFPGTGTESNCLSLIWSINDSRRGDRGFLLRQPGEGAGIDPVHLPQSKYLEAARRTHGVAAMPLRQSLAGAVAIGRGEIRLKLTEEQLKFLRSRS